MKRLFLFLAMLSLTACMNMQTLNEEQRQKPQTHTKYDPNCTREIPLPRTPQGHPDLNSPEYKEKQLNNIHCR